MIDRSATTLLVVDDDPDVLRATARILVQAGYKVITGVNAVQAMELARRHLPAILLLDVMLPDGNGVDVARQLKSEPALAAVHVILLSGTKISSDDQAAGLVAGLADGYITWPFSKPEFLARIDAMLRLRSAQESLREALNLLHQIASQVPGVVFQYRLRPDGSSCFPFASDAMRAIFRVSPDEVRADAGKVLAKLHPDDHDATIASIQNSAKDLTPWVHEFRVKLDDGAVCWLLGHALPQHEADGATLWHGFITDVTDRKQAEAELDQHRHHLEELVISRTIELEKHRQHLEDLVCSRTADLAAARDTAAAANRAKSVFLANMSHELRTPMTGIMGMTELALRRATDAKQIDYLSKSLASSRHLLALISDILDFSRMEADRLTLEEKNFSLAQVIDEVLGMLDEQARGKELRLSRGIAPTLPDWLCGDALRLKQILLNLVGNAIKFSERGQISVHAHALEENRRSLLLRIEVTDQGIGLSAEQQARLFQPFVQGDDSMTRKYGGSGLGLIISKRLAKLMGGDMGVTSEVGIGSTFWITARLRREIHGGQLNISP
ncbi:ATP-binding protein [Accumulibacter sp.]|jgi:PAS domain S-box-containing protein|uniref:ATP-binding protein n=1 Tax=Accumulibacter sp. TaxID=2053492 RepID=UPI002C997E54|nr:ATP-binding protein [Accumulibacter sp.]HPU79820.1 ATP-binding protein [Accumulibacter sp.]